MQRSFSRGGDNRRGPRNHSGGGRRPHNGGGRRSGGGGSRPRPSFDPSLFINKNPVDVDEAVYVPVHKFNEFGLHEDIVKNLSSQGIESPSPIQDETIPLALKGRDVIGLAATGTGKTAAFLLPLIQKTLKNKNQMTLILTPTRELALQVEMEFQKFKSPFNLFATTCVGGTSIRPQIKNLRRHQHFVIGTPGRIKDLANQGYLRLERVNNVVLDEADRMLDMGFIHDMRDILGQVPKTGRQTLFFSATMTKEAEGLVNDFLIDPISVSVKKKDAANSIKQDVVPFEAPNKFDTLLLLLQKPELSRVIIFCEMKHQAERLSQDLVRNGIKAESIHGNKSHGQRQRSLKNFKSGQSRVLVATDVAARGIHVDAVSHVINYDLPGTFEDYVHRIGRTGRGELKGEALTFIPIAGSRGQSDRSSDRAPQREQRFERRQYSTGRTPARQLRQPRPVVADESYETDGAVLVAGAD